MASAIGRFTVQKTLHSRFARWRNHIKMEQIARETEESNQQELGDLNDQIQTKELEQEKL